MEQHPSQVGTPNVAQMHMQQQVQRPEGLGSPAHGSQPMTPQQQLLQHQAQTPGGGREQQFAHEQYQQQQQQQYQGVPPSPSTPAVGQAHPQGANMGTDGSPGMFQRGIHQQMMQQQAAAAAGMPPSYPGYPTAQQQQWAHQQQMQAQAAAAAQQAHYARPPQMMGSQPGQQVMIRRVPYPQGTAYPAGMQPQGGGQQPPPGGFPTRVGAPPPSAMQRHPYPSGTAQPPPGQYPAFPSGQQGYPPGAYQQGMYPPRGPTGAQVGQQMRPYISPQGGMVAQQGVYGNAPAQTTPQTPQTPQQAAPFTPNGTRFPQPTQSPHYPHAGADIRSPSLMSPNHPQQMQAPQMPRPMSNGDMVNQPLRMPVCPPAPAHPNHMQSQYFAHDPTVLPNINSDNCLLGCNIQVFDYERFATDKTDMHNLAIAVRLRGGELDFSAKAYQERPQTITHVVVESFRTPIAQQALKDRKRLVTLQWLTEVLMTGKMEVPHRLAHLPTYCVRQNSAEQLPASGKYFSVSGFDELERGALKWMIEAVGGRVTPNFSRLNHFLLAKHPVGEKYEKAREWEVQVVNYQYIVDLYVMGRQVDSEPARYMAGQPGSELSSTPYALEMIHDSIKNMLYAWKLPIQIHADQWKKAAEIRQTILNDDSLFLNRRYKLNLPNPPTTEMIAAEEKKRREKGLRHNVVVAFDGVDDDVKDVLGKMLMFLGAVVTENVSECTHLVAVQGQRTERLLEAIALGKNIVKVWWIIHGYECRHFLDTFDYFLHDEEAEKQFGYTCKRSVLRARTRPVFEDVTFYITPSVEPSIHVLTRLIRLAGGKVDDQRPDPQMLASCIERDSLYIVISCDADLRSLSYLLDCNFPIYNTEFALMSLLRQEIHPHMIYRIAIPTRRVQIRPQQMPAQQPQQMPGQPGGVPVPMQPQRVAVP